MNAAAARASGILLHPSSLPDPGSSSRTGEAASQPCLEAPGSGDFGASAYHFVDWLATAGQHLWQVLPLGPVGPGYSPYMSPSAFALNPLLIDLQDLVARGWLEPSAAAAAAHRPGFDSGPGPGTGLGADPQPAPECDLGIIGPDGGSELAAAPCRTCRPDATLPAGACAPRGRIDYPTVSRFRMTCLLAAARRFFQEDSAREAFNLFCATEATWLDDYALFMAISERHQGRLWPEWPPALAARDHAALAQARIELDTDLHFWRFVQWTAYRQWTSLKQYANEHGIRIIGDLPIFVALHSADVWADPALFDLQPDLQPRVVAGVPPDYFSATGQLWGNPLYRWDRHAAEGFGWWIRRVKAALTAADLVRIDHFRGFAAYWEVAAGAPDAIDGRWVLGPGAALFDAIKAALHAPPVTGHRGQDMPAGGLPIIAEDLGVVTPDVVALREAVGLPGMRVLQFAFGDDSRNPYLPHNFSPDTVAYSGTHDNDTSVGWFGHASGGERAQVQAYLKTDGREINWDLIHAASQSVAVMSIYPLQDVLGLGSEARMNRPGDAEGCWGWRFDWSQVEPWHAERLRLISTAHGRSA
jgi:4-alpha-glucanotransferase